MTQTMIIRRAQRADESNKNYLMGKLKAGFVIAEHEARRMNVKSISPLISALRKDGHAIKTTRPWCGIGPSLKQSTWYELLRRGA